VSVTGYDGQTTRLQYDAFGRLTAVVAPEDADDKPTVVYSRAESAPLSRVVSETRIWSGKEDVEPCEELYDGSGRKRGTLARDGNGRWVLARILLRRAGIGASLAAGAVRRAGRSSDRRAGDLSCPLPSSGQ
jgi:YD repeat-containing protein